jgi:AcrR family transcriptional regulator
VCALINHERKARAKANREKRRDAIIEAGRRLFSRQPYGSLTLDIVGRRVGVAKGLASLHFATREELYLEVLRRELDLWFDFMESMLGKRRGRIEAGALGRRIAEDLASRPELTGMLRSWHCALEENVEVMPAQTFAEWLSRRATSLGALLDRRCAGFTEGDGPVFLRRLAAVVVGLHQTSALSGIFGAILLDDAYGPLRAEPAAELRAIVTRLAASPRSD